MNKVNIPFDAFFMLFSNIIIIFVRNEFYHHPYIKGHPRGGREGQATPPTFLAFGKIFAKGKNFSKIAQNLAKILISAENSA
jgi:hypothetical protein